MEEKMDFDIVYESMSRTYGELEMIMRSIYQQIKEHPGDEKYLELFQGLGDVAKGMTSSQREFTSIYCDPSIKEALITRMDQRENVLEEALSTLEEKKI